MPPSRLAQQTISFPGEEAWETWLLEEAGPRRLAGDSPATCVAVESMAFDSAPFWSFNAEGLDQSVALRWEGLGLSGVAGARLWTHWPVARNDRHLLVATLAIRGEGPFPQSSAYEPSARMLPLPKKGLAVWRELGRYIVAFTREGRLVHVALLTSRRLDVDAAFEIHDEFAVLRTHRFISELQAIHVWSLCEPDFAPQLACLFGSAEVIIEPRPAPCLPAGASGLLPAQVALQRQRQLHRRHRLLALAAAASVYLLVFGGWWLRLQWLASDLNRAEAELVEKQPAVDLVREARSKWLEMEPAINPDLYPAELFHQIVTLLPDEGVRLKEFQMEGGRLVVSGEAATVNHALGFKERLAGSAWLQRYSWSFPVPTIREDNRADFRAEGILTGGLPDEAQ